MVSVPDFCAAFAVWWGEGKSEDRKIPSNDSIGRALTALGDNRIGIDNHELRDNARRYYGGVYLNNIGMEYWEGAKSEGLAKGKTARTSAGRNDVNRVIPDTWKDRPAVVRIVKAAGATTSGTDAARPDLKGDTSPKF
jgi:hypothetical protein